MTNRERMMKEKEAPSATGNDKDNNKKFPTEYVKRTSLLKFPKKGKLVGRFVGDFHKIVTHDLAPNKHLLLKGVAPEGSFGVRKGEIPFRVKCDNFDEKEESKIAGDCKWDKIHWRAHDMAKWEKNDKKAKATLEAVANATKQNTKYYVNWIDRDDPSYIKKVKVGDKWEEQKVEGCVILGLPKKAFDSVMSLMNSKKVDLSDPDNGYDIEIEKSGTKQDTVYTISFVMSDDMSVKKTPLTEKERKYTIWNPSEHLYDTYDFNEIYPKLYQPFRDVYEITDEKFKEMKDAHKNDKDEDADTAGSSQATAEDGPSSFEEPPADLDPDSIPF